MKTCKTCKWWNADKTQNRPPFTGGICGNSEKIREDGGSDYPVDALVYSYDEGGWFWTGPEFGCVHHYPSDQI